MLGGPDNVEVVCDPVGLPGILLGDNPKIVPVPLFDRWNQWVVRIGAYGVLRSLKSVLTWCSRPGREVP